MVSYTIKQLEIFLAIIDSGSFSRAAEELYLTQSSVSSHLMTLEKLAGGPLIDRSSRRSVRLTERGARLYPVARKIVSDCEELQTLIEEREEEKTAISLGASTVPGQYLLPGFISAYLEQEPKFRYTLRRGDSAEIHRMLADDEIRLGFVGSVLDPAAFEYIPLAADHLVMVAPNTDMYRKMQERGLFGRDLLGEPTVARETGSGTDRAVQNYMRSIGFPPSELRITARIDDPETIKRMVENGAGVSVLSSLAVSEEVKSGRLLQFEMDSSGLRREIYLITKKETEYSEHEQRLIACLRSHAGKTK